MPNLPKLLTFSQLRAIYGIPRTSAYRWMETLDFPKPIQLAPNSVRLDREAVESWIESRPNAPVFDAGGV